MPAVSSSALSAQVHAAHADSWAALGRLFAPRGGAAARLPGVRLAASGLPYPQWNGADLTDPALIEAGAVRDWFAARGPAGQGVPWGLRVPAGMPWSRGPKVAALRCAVLLPSWLDPAPVPSEVRLREATPADADAVAEVDARAFGSTPERSRAWLAPRLEREGADAGMFVVLAERGGVPVGAAAGIVTDEQAGPAVGVFGVGVVPEARRQGIAAAMTTAAVLRGLLSGAAFAHLNPDTDEAARLYARLGFVETDGIDVFIDL